MKIIKLALRSLLHFRLYSIVNIIGLALSLACVIIIFRYVHGEMTVDHFNKKLDRIYVTTEKMSLNSGKRMIRGVANPNNETTFVDITNHPSVELFSHFVLSQDGEIDIDDQKYNANILAADSNFFKIMDFPIIEGVAELSAPQTALVTQAFAEKLFDKENPIGKTFKYMNGKVLTINGVIGKNETKSSLNFDVVISYYLPAYWNRIHQTLVLLYPDSDYKAINKEYNNFFEMPAWEYSILYQLFPLKDIYLNRGAIEPFDFTTGNKTYTIVLLIVGLLILLVGIVNFVNIYTVVVMRRGREFGMKKVFGAQGTKVFFQLWIENLCLITISLVVGLALSELMNPFVKNVLGFDQFPYVAFDLFLSLSLLIILPLVTTIYPFVKYNYSAPIKSLRGVMNIGGFSVTRRLFLVFQYVLTIGMIIISLFFVKQLNFMLHADLGYNTKDIIMVKFMRSETGEEYINDMDAWKKKKMREMQMVQEIDQRLNSCPYISHWSKIESPNEAGVSFIRFKSQAEDYREVILLDANEAWMKMFDIQLVEGRLWNDSIDVDCRDYQVIVSESALKEFGITDYTQGELQPDRRLWYNTDKEDEMKTNPPYRIVGVVKDFHTSHLSKKSLPILITYGSGFRDSYTYASIIPDRKKEAIAYLHKLHDDTVGGEFSYTFVEDEVEAMYREDKRVAVIYSIFTTIAIFISILGLFSMSLFDVQQRYKEIAIRKVNGATAFEIVRLLLKRYFILLVISFVIAAPLAWLAIDRYLEDFANKTPVSWWLFVVAFLVTAIISLFTLIYQTQKAAGMNPANATKSE